MKKFILGLALSLALAGSAAAANFSKTTTGLLFDMDTRGYSGISIGVGGSASGHTLIVEANSDPTGVGTWYTILCTPMDASSSPTTNIATAGKGYVCPVPAPRVRARITAISSGTYTVSVAYVGLGVASAAGGTGGGGLSVHDSGSLDTLAAAASATTPSLVGCLASSTVPTAASDATKAANRCDLLGNLVTTLYAIPENSTIGLITTAMTGTTSTAVSGMGAPGSGLRNYVTEVSCANTHASVDTLVNLQDGSGGTVITQLFCPHGGGHQKPLPKPLRQPTTNTALYAVDVTTGASVTLSATGYKAP